MHDFPDLIVEKGNIITIGLEKGKTSQMITSNETTPTTTTTTRTKTTANPVFFVHFAKSGGSSVCATMSKMMNMTDIEGNRDYKRSNCNTYFSDPHCKNAECRSRQTCDNFIPYTTDEHGVPFLRSNFLASEVPLRQELPCEPGNFRSFAIMRHPTARFISLLNYLPRLGEEEVIGWIVEKKHCKVAPCPASKGYQVTNSENIRQLLGQKRYTNPDPINEQDFERAKALIGKFDAFVPMEYLHHSAVLNILKDKIPEYYNGLIQLNRTTNVNKHKSEKPSAKLLQLITQENKYDIMLYEYVLETLGISNVV